MSKKKKDFLIALIFLLLVVIFFWRIIFGGEVLIPSGSLYTGSPWDYYKSTRPPVTSLGQITDVLEEFYPWLHYASRQVREGKIPLWNSLICCGLPLAGEIQSGIFYPFNIFFYFFTVPTAFGYRTMLHFFLMGLFTYLFMRIIGVSKIGAFLGATVATFNGTFVCRIFPSGITAAIWLPLVLFFYEKSLKERRYLYSLLGGLGLGMGFLTGELKFVICILLILFFYSLFRIFAMLKKKEKEPIPRAIHSFFLIFLFGVLIGAIIIIPLLETLLLSSRGSSIIETTPFQWPWHYFRLLLVSGVDFHTGHLVYVGPLVVLLSIFALIKREKGSFHWGSLVVVLLLLQKGCILDKLFSYLIPGFKMLAFYDGGIFTAVTFPIAILAGLGLDTLFKKKRNKPPVPLGIREVFKYLIVIGVIVNLFVIGMRYLIPWTGKSEDCYFETEATNYLRNDRELYRIIRFDPLPFANDRSYILPCNTGMVYGISDAQGYASFLVRRHGEFMDIIEPGMCRKKVLDSRILEVRNPENLNSKLIDLANIKYVLTKHIVPSEKYQLVYWKEFKIYQNKDYFSRAFIVPYAKVIKEKEEILKYMRSEDFDPTQEVVIEEPVLYSSGHTAFPYWLKVKKYESDLVEIEVNANKSGWLVLSDTYYPGWKVYVDGKKEKIYRANYCFRALPLLRGNHRIKFIYRPFSFYSGLGISSTALAVLLFLLGKSIFYSKPKHFVSKKGKDRSELPDTLKGMDLRARKTYEDSINKPTIF